VSRNTAGVEHLVRRTERALFDRGRQVYVLDGDNVRLGLSSDLGFSVAERDENLRRLAETAAMLVGYVERQIAGKSGSGLEWMRPGTPRTADRCVDSRSDPAVSTPAQFDNIKTSF
jgi:hypothetical protein